MKKVRVERFGSSLKDFLSMVTVAPAAKKTQRVREGYNPYHVPAGSPGGGQFTSGDGGGAGSEGVKTDAAARDRYVKEVSKYVDDPHVVQQLADAQAKADAIPRTDTINTPERLALREDVAQNTYGNGARNKDSEAWFVTGLPASGKNAAISNPLMEKNGAMLIDSDEIKSQLPEYAGGIGAAAVHEEATMIQTAVLERAVNAGDNIVMPRVGKSYAGMENDITMLQKAGYSVHLVYVDVPDKMAIQRAVARFQKTGRLVSVEYIHSVNGHPRNTFNKLRAAGIGDSFSAYDNSGPKGSTPKRILL